MKRLRAEVIWTLDKWNHLLLRQFCLRSLCDYNDRLIIGKPKGKR